jgi:protoporphyrinogen oxidase
MKEAVGDPIVILGAGLAGLSAAYHAQKKGLPYLLFEKESRPGGLVRSERVNGFSFDYTGHLLHVKEERTRQLVLKDLQLEKAFVSVQRDSWVYMNGRYTRAPFQANLYGQPGSVITECLDGILRAHGHLPGGLPPKDGLPDFFEEWNLRAFGAGIYKHFMEPYNTKLWGIHPSQMTTGFMGRFVPRPSLTQVFDGALRDVGKPMGYNANFIYPKQIGIEILSRAFAKALTVHCNVQAVSVDPKRKEVTLSNGETVRYRKLISTQHLPALVGMTQGTPAAVKAAAKKLRASSVLNVNYGIAGRNVSTKQWVYVPEPHLPFYRVGFYHNFSKALAPKGGSSVYAEMSYSPTRPLDKQKAPARVRQGLIEMGVLRASDKIAATFVADIKNAYVVYDAHRADAVAKIQAYYRSQGIASTGRWGNWEYAAMEDAIWQGEAALH